VGDSRVSRLGGPLVAKPTAADAACLRSTDSLADEIGGQLDQRVLNLSCPGASIESGLRGPQAQGGQDLPAQIGLLKQVQGLKWVVVSVGPNDLAWTDLLRYCYAVSNCQDNLTQGEFDYRLAAFDRDYGALLRDLNDLPDRPQIIILTSYDVFKAGADCRDAKGPPPAGGLSPANIEVLLHRNAELNDVLTAGAKKYDFDVASPRLTTLCEPDTDKLGGDIQGFDDQYPFHPTGVGMIRMAAAVARVIHPTE
jgi:lysophospholipase L1-like esterase